MPDPAADALTAAFERHRPRLAACVERRLSAGVRRRFGVEDVLQEAYQRVLRLPARPPADGEFLAFYREAMDGLAELTRKATAECRDVGREAWLPDLSSFAFHPPDTATGPVSTAQRAEQNAAVHAVIAQLSETDQRVLQLFGLDQLSHAEVGAVLGISAGTAAVRYHRAVQAFTKLMQAQFPEFAHGSHHQPG